jgi:hypothetical protein
MKSRRMRFVEACRAYDKDENYINILNGKPEVKGPF